MAKEGFVRWLIKDAIREVEGLRRDLSRPQHQVSKDNPTSNQERNPPLNPTVSQNNPVVAHEPGNPILSGRIVGQIRKNVQDFKARSAPVKDQEVDRHPKPETQRFLQRSQPTEPTRQHQDELDRRTRKLSHSLQID